MELEPTPPIPRSPIAVDGGLIFEDMADVRIKVEDGVIVFPYEAMGHEAKAEGIFEAIKLTPEQIEARTAAAHKHKEGESCDKDGANAQAGTGCDLEPVNQYVYLIRGTGAVIKG